MYHRHIHFSYCNIIGDINMTLSRVDDILDNRPPFDNGILLRGKRVNVFLKGNILAVSGGICVGKRLVAEMPSASDVLVFDRGDGDYTLIRERDIIIIDIKEHGEIKE